MSVINLAARCPKCGSMDWHRNWMPARPLGIYVSCHDLDQNREEHIHSRCKVCSYEQDDVPLSGTQPTAPAAPKAPERQPRIGELTWAQRMAKEPPATGCCAACGTMYRGAARCENPACPKNTTGSAP